jgi:hypothetical protein
MSRELKVGLFVIAGLALGMLGVFLIGNTKQLWEQKVVYKHRLPRRRRSQAGRSHTHGRPRRRYRDGDRPRSATSPTHASS